MTVLAFRDTDAMVEVRCGANVAFVPDVSDSLVIELCDDFRSMVGGTVVADDYLQVRIRLLHCPLNDGLKILVCSIVGGYPDGNKRVFGLRHGSYSIISVVVQVGISIVNPKPVNSEKQDLVESPFPE